MESFLSRVTGKTFPGVYWSPFDEFFIFEKHCEVTKIQIWRRTVKMINYLIRKSRQNILLQLQLKQD